MVAVVPSVGDRALLRTALALAHGANRRLRALALHDPADDLPLPLRIQLYGLTVRSQADVALRHVVAQAFHGQRLDVRAIDPIEHKGDSAAVHALGPDALLVLGMTKDGTPRLSALQVLADGHPGTVVLLADSGGPAFEEVLSIEGDPDSQPALASIRHALETCYPVFTARKAASALPDCTARTLVITGAGEPPLGIARWWGAAPGPVAVVLPRYGRAEALERWLAPALDAAAVAATVAPG